MYMLRHSVVETGSQMIRVSRRGLTSGVVKSAYDGTRSGGSDGVSALSYATAQGALEGLEAMGAIRREADPNREGALFRVLLPEEIEVCRRAREARNAATPPRAIDEAREADYYNVRENRVKVYERDKYLCRYCQKQLTRFTATLDHVHPVAEGGDNSFGNLVTACLECNSRKNVRPVGDFLAEKV
jgi:DNA-binding MarR family transcriptional regulator